ncbi:hypothetical protein HIF96_07445 [Helcococcus kunzii]|nr:hypothetical protein [Helcococcus kunzii]QZO76112.1 hypothetical protein HIF96_07445 [Helcococcus kunzii]
MYKNNREETNSEEYKTLIEQFNNYVKRINTDFMLEDFSKRLENNEVKNDGTDSLLKIIDKYILKDNSEFIKIIDKGTIMYRARIIEHNHINKHYLSINDEKLMGYDESNSREAPLGIGNEGRNNIKGM